MHFRIDWASLVGSKFTVFALFYFVFECSFPSTSPPGGLILTLEGCFNRGFFALPVLGGGGVGLYLEGLIHGGAYFQNFTVFDFPLSSFNYLLKKNYVDTVSTSGESLQFSLQPVLHCKCILGLKWSISELEL